MNKNRDGSDLTTEQLAQICVDAGIRNESQLQSMSAGLHNEALIQSELLSLTARTRFEMFMRGELSLSTRNEKNSPS